jgi:DNA helicase II / ATP-dependent DNA helicase PcrA
MELYPQKLQQIEKDREQYEAFESNTSTVVLAGPGSGKTTVLTLKIMKLLNEKIDIPRGLACITFSKEAAKEFTYRIKKMGYQKRNNVFLGTVHAFCIAHILKPFAHLFDDGFPLPLDIITEREKTSLYKAIQEKFNLDPWEYTKERLDTERCHSINGLSKVPFTPNPILTEAIKDYEQRLRNLGKTDFIEIIKYSNELIVREEYVRQCLEAKFPWILIDEYQDNAKPMHEMILALLRTTNIKIFAVGDPDQSIYSFNGAIPDFLLELLVNSELKSIHLKTNYRSNQEIINASAIALNLDDREYKAGTRHGESAEFHFITCDKELTDQYDYVINTIIPQCKKDGIEFDEICVLVNSGAAANTLASIMEQHNIPCYLAKFDFANSDVILWLKDCTSWLTDPSSKLFTEISNFWIKLCMNFSTNFLEEEQIILRKNFYSTLVASKKHEQNLLDWLTFLEQHLNLFQTVKNVDKYQEEQKYLGNLFESAKNGKYKTYDITKFSLLGKPNNQVTISTRHSSKGLEFEVVIMLGMEEGIFPYYKNVDDANKLNEDRRLFFVCLTRAKRVCYLLRSKRYLKRSGYGFYQKEPSMFWIELYNACQEKNISTFIN